MKILKLKIFDRQKVKESLTDELTPYEIKNLNQSRKAFTNKEISYIEKNKPYLLASNQKEDIREIINSGFPLMSKEFSIELLSRRFAFYQTMFIGKNVDTAQDLSVRSLRARDCLMNGLYFDTLKPIKE